ncbi:hypothetical protein [Stutzerimonas nitrititolerans]|uniref:hypothetical protein n=1 Tax=Stutzerimonas nitrititolerans TaxID=2482751 RepID=UPI0028A0C4CB|nr:hypothetical protein [Stutzerimonas nitrititolerans]
MSFTKFSAEQLEQVNEAVLDTGRLKRRTEVVMNKLIALAETDYIAENIGLHIEAQPDGFYSINTPYGNGRGRTELAVSPEGHQAIVHIEKAVINRLDQTEWHPVWALTFRGKGTYAGDSNESFEVGSFDDDGLPEILNSIVYAIAKA